VDHDPALHGILAAELAGVGYSVDHADSGAAGFDRALRTRPDAIVLDWPPPDVQSFDVASALEQHAETAHVPIVVLTEQESSAEARRRFAGRAAGLVVKGRAAPGRLLAALREIDDKVVSEVARAR
jgi:DNA-binding response OmpR family regulator